MHVAIIWFLCLAAVTCSVRAQQAETKAPPATFRRVHLIDFRKKGMGVFTFCPASRDLLFACTEDSNRILYRWNVDTRRQAASYEAPKSYRCDEARQSPDGRLLVLATYDMLHDVLDHDFRVMVIDVQTGETIKTLSYRYPIRAIQFRRDGQRFWLAPTYPGRDPFVYDWKGDKHTHFDASAFAPENNPIFTYGGSKDGSLWIKREKTRSKLLDDPCEYLLTDDGRWVASSTLGGEVVVWRASDLKEVYRSKFGGHPIYLQFDPKMNRFLVGTGNNNESATLQAIEIATQK